MLLKEKTSAGGLIGWEQSECLLFVYYSVLKGRHSAETMGWCQGRVAGGPAGCEDVRGEKGFGGSGTTGRSLRPHNVGFLTVLEGPDCVDIQRGSSVQWRGHAGDASQEVNLSMSGHTDLCFLCSIAA